MTRMLGILLCACCCASVGLAGQQIAIPVNATMDQNQIADKAFADALGKEVESILGVPLAAKRIAILSGMLLPERSAFVIGMNQVSNATNGTVVMDVQLDSEKVKARLKDTGVYYTASAPMNFGLLAGGVDPKKLKRLGTLQELSGLRPVGAEGTDQPLLKLDMDTAGVWTGTLTSGAWSDMKSGKSLDAVWFPLWKAYFSRPEIQAKSGTSLRVTISGWVSSMGPMEFDRLMDAWSSEVEQKSLENVGMDSRGVVGVWQIRSRRSEALTTRLQDATRAQGLRLEVQ